MNKNIFKTLSIIVLAALIVIIAAKSGFCVEDLATQLPEVENNAVESKSDTIIKFLIAMGGVMLSSFVIFLGLTIYNKFFVDKSLFPNNGPDDILNTPKTIDEAVTLFIKRNKLC